MAGALEYLVVGLMLRFRPTTSPPIRFVPPSFRHLRHAPEVRPIPHRSFSLLPLLTARVDCERPQASSSRILSLPCSSTTTPLSSSSPPCQSGHSPSPASLRHRTPGGVRGCGCLASSNSCGSSAPGKAAPWAMWRTTTCCFLSRASSSAPSRDGHGRPMSGHRRARTRRHPDPLHTIPISPETCTKSRAMPAPHFGPCPATLQPERFSRLAPEAEERSYLPRVSSAGKPAGRPDLLLASARMHNRRDCSPHSWARAARMLAAMHHPLLGSCDADAGG